MSRLPENFNQSEFPTTSDINAILSALKGSLLPRGFGGEVESGSDLGSASFPWGTVFANSLSVGSGGSVSAVSLREFVNYTAGQGEVKKTIRYPQELPNNYVTFTPINFAFSPNSRGAIITVPYQLAVFDEHNSKISQQDKLLYHYIPFTDSSVITIRLGHKSTRFFNLYTGNPPTSAQSSTSGRLCNAITIGAVEIRQGNVIVASVVTTQNGSTTIPTNTVPTVANNVFSPEAKITGFKSAGLDVGTVSDLDYFEAGFFEDTYLNNSSLFTPITITEV